MDTSWEPDRGSFSKIMNSHIPSSPEYRLKCRKAFWSFEEHEMAA